MVEDKLGAALSAIQNKGVDVYLLAILKMDEITDRWSIILSAPFKDESERKKTAKDFIDILAKLLDKSDIETIARVGVFPPNLHLVEELLNFKVGNISTPVKVNGNTIHEGKILKSKTTGDGSQTSLLDGMDTSV